MYDKRYSLALKTGCFCCCWWPWWWAWPAGAAACHLADQGAYTISREDMLEMGLQERCGTVADNVARAYAQETYGAAEEDLPGYLFAYAYDGHWQLYPQYYMGQSNYRYEIRDGAGNLFEEHLQRRRVPGPAGVRPDRKRNPGGQPALRRPAGGDGVQRHILESRGPDLYRHRLRAAGSGL